MNWGIHKLWPSPSRNPHSAMATPKGMERPGKGSGKRKGTQSNTMRVGRPRKWRCSTTVRNFIGCPGAIAKRLSSSSLRRRACDRGPESVVGIELLIAAAI